MDDETILLLVKEKKFEEAISKYIDKKKFEEAEKFCSSYKSEGLLTNEQLNVIFLYSNLILRNVVKSKLRNVLGLNYFE